MIKIVNQQTGEEIVRELTAEELAEIEQAEAERLAIEQAEAEKQSKLESAKAKLAALGLDEDEVNVMLGIN